MSCLGAPACRVDVWVIGVNPEIIVVTPAIKVELGKKGPRGSGIALGAQLRQEVGWAQRFSPSLCQDPGDEEHKGHLHSNCFWPCILRATLVKMSSFPLLCRTRIVRPILQMVRLAWRGKGIYSSHKSKSQIRGKK